MKSLIEVYRKNSNYTSYYIVNNTLEVIKDRDPQHIWDDIKQVVRDLQDISSLNYESFIERLLEFDVYTDQIEEGTDWYDYYIEIYYDDDCITIIGHDMGSEQIECLRENLKININNEGNCIDDFIIRGVEPLLDNINELKKSIQSRLEERKNTTEYHQTACYEKDFFQISLIKKHAEKIVENCNKHLEKISEFYTRLS